MITLTGCITHRLTKEQNFYYEEVKTKKELQSAIGAIYDSLKDEPALQIDLRMVVK